MRSFLQRARGAFYMLMSRPLNVTVLILLFVYTLMWGIWVANPFWMVFTTAPLYTALAAFAPEVVWGGAAIIGAATTAWGIFTDSYLWKRIGVGIITWQWGLVTIFYFMGDWQNTGGITALFVAVFAAIVFVKLKLNRDDEFKS